MTVQKNWQQPKDLNMTTAIGYAAKSASSDLKPFEFERRTPAATDVAIDILYCGVCHSDVHQARNEWKNTVYPCLPGHEIVGRVKSVGNAVTKFKIGDLVGVGCMVDSCHDCESCQEGLENYCSDAEGFLATYNGKMRKPSKDNLTYGGYSDHIVVREDFVLRIPDNLDVTKVAPLLCAGITTYSPLKHWKVGTGSKVGVIGMGGLGHTAIKIAAAMGATVTLITRSPEKADDARKIGANNVIISTDAKTMQAHASHFDFILSTIPQPHDINLYLPLLKRDGTITVVGCIAPLTKPVNLALMVPDRKSIGTSLIGGIAETQEMLDFCSQHNIVPLTKTIPIDDVNMVFDKLNEGAVDFRYVIDIATIKGKTEDKSLLEKIGL